jgi:hypothetical protein
VKVAAIPHIAGMTTEVLLNYAKAHEELKSYLPDEQDWVHLDKQWIADVLYTKDQRGIEGIIEHAREERKEKLEEKKHELIEMRPEFADALKVCLNFSGKY